MENIPWKSVGKRPNIAQSKAKCYISSQDHSLNAIFPYSTSLGNALTLIENLLGCMPHHYRTV